MRNALIISLGIHLTVLGFSARRILQRERNHFIAVDLVKIKTPPRLKTEIRDSRPVSLSETTLSDEKRILKYQDIVKARISRYRRYPSRARRAGWEGRVEVGFTILSNGRLKEMRIISPSRYPLLDRAALSTLKRAGPFPPFPEGIEQKEIEMLVSLVYRLNTSGE